MCGRNKQKSNYLFSIYLGGKNPIKQKKAHYEMDMFFGWGLRVYNPLRDMSILIFLKLFLKEVYFYNFLLK